MTDLLEMIKQTSDFLKKKTDRTYNYGVILGSGLGSFAKEIKIHQQIPYAEIPNFPQATVEGHEGRLIFGNVNGREVVLMQGRFHYYEGYSMKEVAYPVYVMQQLGITSLIITNACGGINTNFKPGTLMIIKDFINLFGDNPLIGLNDERFGTRFPDMSEPYKLELIRIAKESAGAIGIEYQEGIYAGFMGPYYETGAEIVAIGRMGADAVGMSTVPETIAANYLGMNVLGISCITNMATGIQQGKHSHNNVVDNAKKASSNLCAWIMKIIENITES